MSWESLNEIIDRSEDEQQARDIATAYFNCFNTDAGVWVLDDLVSKFLTKPIVRPNEDAYSQGIREGRADLVRQILIQLHYATSPKSTENGIFVFLKKFKKKIKG